MNDKIVNNRVDWSDTKYYCNNILEHARPLIDIAKILTNDNYGIVTTANQSGTHK